MCLCVRTITFEQNDLWPSYFACWSFLIISRSSLKVKVIGQCSWSHDEECFFDYRCTFRDYIYYGCMLRREAFFVACPVLSAKVAGATSSDGFLVI